MAATHRWTDTREARVKQLFLEGASYEAIAKDLGGITRSAVSGRVRHLREKGELPPVTSPDGSVRTPAVAPRARSAPVVMRAAPPLITKPSPAPAKFTGGRVYAMPASVPLPKASDIDSTATMRPWEERRRGQCAWPVDGPDGAAWSCCRSSPENTAITYCDEHRAVAFRPVPSSPKRFERSLRKYA